MICTALAVCRLYPRPGASFSLSNTILAGAVHPVMDTEPKGLPIVYLTHGNIQAENTARQQSAVSVECWDVSRATKETHVGPKLSVSTYELIPGVIGTR